MDFSINEHVSVLIDGKWERAIIKIRLLGGKSYRVTRFDVSAGREVPSNIPADRKCISRLSVYACQHCGNWIDPDKLPKTELLPGSKGVVNIKSEPICYHNVERSMGYHMRRQPWIEVAGVSAIGGIHSVPISPITRGVVRGRVGL